MSAIEKVLSLRDRSWRYLEDPFGSSSQAVYEDGPLEVPPPMEVRLTIPESNNHGDLPSIQPQ